MVLLWIVPFVMFAALDIYSLAARAEYQPRAGRTEPPQMAVPIVAVIHATPLNVDAGLVLAGGPCKRTWIRQSTREPMAILKNGTGHRQPREARRPAGGN